MGVVFFMVRFWGSFREGFWDLRSSRASRRIDWVSGFGGGGGGVLVEIVGSVVIAGLP